MKSHFVNIFFKNVYGQNYIFQGRVIGKQLENGKVVISVNKLFYNVFGFDLPSYSEIQIH